MVINKQPMFNNAKKVRIAAELEKKEQPHSWTQNIIRHSIWCFGFIVEIYS